MKTLKRISMFLFVFLVIDLFLGMTNLRKKVYRNQERIDALYKLEILRFRQRLNDSDESS